MTAEEARARLREIDLASVRAIRAEILGRATAEDLRRLKELEEEAECLRKGDGPWTGK
jgi:hypothetical protein